MDCHMCHKIGTSVMQLKLNCVYYIVMFGCLPYLADEFSPDSADVTR